MSIAENILKIEERLMNVCQRTGRKREEITLMGVSKFVPIEQISEAFNAGIKCFGESRVQEAIEKFEIIKTNYPDYFDHNLKLHMIGSLQRNKAKLAYNFFDCIQSVDRLELVQQLIKTSVDQPRDKPLEILLELHTAEDSKSGFLDIPSMINAVELLLNSPSLKIMGLMTMAPFTTETKVIRSSFKMLVNAQKELEKQFPNENWSVLSMGMSNDYEIAVEEGSTLLRIGSAIFN